MERRKLLLAGGLVCIILFLSAIGVFIFNTNTDPAGADDSTYYSDDPDEEYLSFDNSTPKTKAMSIARLYYGVSGFYTCHTLNASLTSDGRYWIVQMDEDIVVTVDAKTWSSKQEGDLNQPANTWRSLDDLKAQYIAEIQCLGENTAGRPYKVTMDSKEIWKVPVYNSGFNDQGEYIGKKLIGYVYVDLATGKSKNTVENFKEIASVNFEGDEWLTLKQVDNITGWWPYPFKDALRDLYPE